jgi:predicted amidophosphoribosyltransferase
LVWACSATPPVGVIAAPTNAKSPSLVTSGTGRLCPNCGTSAGADAAFCPQCGARREDMNVVNERADV